ncbi:MAG TPA: TadE/TadG family type IV pilus assembly protein [Acidimicrobiales bacterium]|jgi:Flp pilus assembly protein TadG|nr:TadE/TadG family type IV pilus assembly protein [Acidimicrobiales bacterium]
MGVSTEIRRRGVTTLGPRTRNFAKRLRREPGDDERGAELLEFALVVVLLITLLYGIITYGVILSAQATVTQAAADAARSGIVQGTSTGSCNNISGVDLAGCAAVQEAATDLGWMNKNGCVEWVNTTTPTVTTNNVTPTGNTTSPITCTATIEQCPSVSANTCLSVAVSYNYSSAPLFPELPGLGVITPSTISSTNVLQLSTPSGS